MKTFSFVALFVLCLTEASAKRIPSFAGPYRYLINRISNESDAFTSTGNAWLQLHTTQVRGKQVQYGWGKAYVDVPFSDALTVEVNMAVRSNNQWKPNAFVFKFNRPCTEAPKHAPDILDLVYGSDHDFTKCPIAPIGLREIKNHSFNMNFPYFPVMPYGRYLLSFVLKMGTNTLGGAVADGELVPKL